VEVASSAGPIGSGFTFPAQVTEEYRLRDGSRRQLPAYTVQLPAFRVPGRTANATTVAEFALRPFQLLAGEELADAVVRVEVLAPAAFAGSVLAPAGGSLNDGDLGVTASAGDFARPEAAVLRRLNVAPDWFRPASRSPAPLNSAWPARQPGGRWECNWAR
jgi:hypothetical protein